MKSGSVLSLRVSTACGLRPKARQIAWCTLEDHASLVTTGRSRRTMWVCEMLQAIPYPAKVKGRGGSRCSCPADTGGVRKHQASSAARDGGSRSRSPGRQHPRPGAVPPCCSVHWRPQLTWWPRCSPRSRSQVPGACWSAGTACTRWRLLPGGSWPQPLGNYPDPNRPRRPWSRSRRIGHLRLASTWPCGTFPD